MFWLIGTIVLGLVAVGAVFVTSDDPKARPAGVGVAALCLLVWLVLTFFASIHTVGQRQVGIVYNFSGTISSGKKDPGVVFTAPWQHIKKENVGIQGEEIDLTPDNAAVSSDQQPIYARLFVNFQVQPKDVVRLYKEVGPSWKRILLEPRALQDFKEITSTFLTVEMTTHRQQLRKLTRDRLEEELSKYDIKIVDVFVKNIDFATSYKRAVESKQVAVQEALQAKQQADTKRNLARGEADAIFLKGRALKRNPQILQLEAIDKLAPTVTTVICTGKTCPSFLPQSLASPETK